AGILSRAVDTAQGGRMRYFVRALRAALSVTLAGAIVVLSGIGANAAGPLGTIEVRTDPEGAAVFVNGEPRGVTPVAVANLPAGEHRVRVVKDGFVENSRVVSVAAGSRRALDVRLTQAPATPPPAPEASGGEGWSTKKKVLVGAGAAAVLVGGILLLGGG